MFWKRKPKRQDGQEATDSAVEAAADKEEAATEQDGGESAEKPETEEVTAGTGAGTSADDGDAADDTDDGPQAEKKSSEAEEEAEAGDVFADEGEEVGVTGPDGDGITRVRTAGVFEFEGEKSDVVSNTWIVKADDEGVVVIDPAHDAEAILKAVGDREVYLVACTNAYGPHIESAIKVAEEFEAPIALHPREMRAWRRHHGAERRPEIEVEGQGALDIGDLHIDVLALPGTSTGTVGYYISELGVVFGGDTLRKGEPGMVGNTYVDYTTQLASIGEALLSLPPDTRILPDRGPSTTSGAESKNFDSWV